jgi:hypothetical protein
MKSSPTLTRWRNSSTTSSVKLEQDGPPREVKTSISVSEIAFFSSFIGRGNEFGGAEEDEAVEDKAEKVLDVVASFNLNETSFGKSDFMTYFKSFMKKVKTHLEKENAERVAGFVEGAKEVANWINKNFDEFQL